MKAIALKLFGDGKRLYKEGEITEITQKQFDELNATPNGPLLEAVEDDTPEFPQHVGGGTYELSNGEKVKGKDAAIKAQAELDATPPNTPTAGDKEKDPDGMDPGDEGFNPLSGSEQ